MRKMKDSGIAWIGEIPQEWEVKKYKYLANLYTGNSIKDEEKQNYEDEFEAHPYIASKDIDGDTFTVSYDNGMYVKNIDSEFVRACKNDILICVEGGSAGRKIAYLDRDVSFVNKLCCYHTYGCVSKFIYYSMISPSYKTEFDLNLTGLIGGVSVSKLNNFFVPLPPFPEQQAIADKLDKVCGEIDKVIAKTKAVVEEYKKFKQAIITEAVTGKKQCVMRNSQCGIKEKRPMKDSGIAWIGEIPQSWEVTKVKRFYQVTLGKMLQPIQQYDDETCEDYLCAMNVNNCFINFCDLKQMWFSEAEKHELVLKRGDLIVVEGGDVGDCAIIKCEVNNLYFQNALHRVRIKNDMDSKVLIEFLMYQIINAKNSGHIDLICNKATIAHFTKEKLQNLIFLFPPLPEQEAIVAYLDAKCGAIDEVIAKKQQLITEMENYKKSVIYEYVTGKREVG